jgi:hypothetical protein
VAAALSEVAGSIPDKDNERIERETTVPPPVIELGPSLEILRGVPENGIRGITYAVRSGS